MKPLLIFQLPNDMPLNEQREVQEVISAGIKEGSLIVRSDITILSFDRNGDLNYLTKQG